MVEKEKIPPDVLAAALSSDRLNMLDSLVIDCASKTAAAINNGGPETQIRYLRKIGFSWKYIREALEA
jgi:hypothetical protein